MMHLFDPRTIFLAKHAQHIVMVHFPIALFSVSFIFDILAVWRKNPVLSDAAYYNLVAAAVSSLLTVFTGIMAWQLIYEGEAPRGILLYHLIAAGSATIGIWALTITRFRRRRRDVRIAGIGYIACTCLAVLVILVTAHLGGILSGLIQLPE